MPIPGVHALNYLPVEADQAGDNSLVLGVGGSRVVVVAYVLTNGDNTNPVEVTFKDDLGPLTGPMFLRAGGSIVFPGRPEAPAFRASRGSDVVLELSAAAPVAGHVTFLLTE